MPDINLNFDPVDHITVDAIGQPGQRIFYLQARQGAQTATLIIEKFQLESLRMGLTELFEEIRANFPNLPAPDTHLDESRMAILPPLDPLFRVGDMGMVFDDERDLVCLIAREMDPASRILNDEELEVAQDGNVVRFWCTRAQMLELQMWSALVIARGRPICPQCQQPMEPEGHFCPKKNGHKKPAAD
jgi:uncharacterized repeat protein (TIGR03847 family)